MYVSRYASESWHRKCFMIVKAISDQITIVDGGSKSKKTPLNLLHLGTLDTGVIQGRIHGLVK